MDFQHLGLRTIDRRYHIANELDRLGYESFSLGISIVASVHPYLMIMQPLRRRRRSLQLTSLSFYGVHNHLRSGGSLYFTH